MKVFYALIAAAALCFAPAVAEASHRVVVVRHHHHHRAFVVRPVVVARPVVVVRPAAVVVTPVLVNGCVAPVFVPHRTFGIYR